MRAIVCTGYGPPGVLVARDVAAPIPRPGEIRVRIVAVPITVPDRRIRSLDVPFLRVAPLIRLYLRARFGLRRPRSPILGNYFSGIVDSIGAGVDDHRVGDEVFGYSGDRRSTYAEYICLPANAIIADRPTGLSLTQAAAIPYGGCNALHFLYRAGGVHPGQKVLIRGAAGVIGSSAVQLAKSFGAEVTGLCSPSRQGFVDSLGADHTVIDDTRPLGRYDVIIDAAGGTTKSSWTDNLAAGGRFVTVFSKKTEIMREDLVVLKRLAETGSFQPVIDKCYPLEQTAEAHTYADQGHPHGTVLIVNQPERTEQP